jgi:putative inorganic carbon (HCO3(-)) transporter
LLGGGFDSWGKDTFSIYSPQADFVAVAHSIYFNVLADHGWIGLFLFLGILYASWRNLSTVIRLSEPDSRLNLLSRMLQVSFVAYLTGGAFLSLSYFDLPWHLIAITLLLKKELNTPQAVAVNQQQITRQGL